MKELNIEIELYYPNGEDKIEATFEELVKKFGGTMEDHE